MKAMGSDHEDVELTSAEKAEVEAAVAEADRGGGVPAEEVLRELRARARREEPAHRG
jgi:predicted transcriptional regulator